jgi:hypothetical protein
MEDRRSPWVWIVTRLGTLGWGTLMAGALLGLFEWSGLGTSWVHSILTTRMAALGGELHLGKADFQWLEPSLVLEDLSLRTDEELLSIKHLHVRFGWQGGLSLVPTEVHLDGARVLLDPAIAARVRGLLDVPGAVPANSEEKESEAARLPRLPEVLLEDLTVLVRTSAGEQLEVLHVDLSMQETNGLPRIVGRVQTPRQHSDGAPGSIRLSGGVNREGVLNLQGQALDLEITPEDVPGAPEFEALAAWEPKGVLDLKALISVDLLKDQAPRAEFTGRLVEGSLLPPRAELPIRDLQVLYELIFDPGEGEWLWDTTAWEGVARAEGGFAEEVFTAGALVGRSARSDSHLEAWVHLDGVSIDAPVDKLLSNARWYEDLHMGTAPKGYFSARVMTRLPRLTKEEADGATPRPELLAHVDVQAGTEFTYHGWPSRTAGRAPTGFPLPVKVQRGEVLHAYTRLLPRRAILHVDVEVEQPSGPAQVRYLARSAPVDTPPFASGSEEHLSIQASGLEVNPELERAVRGLDSVLGEGRIWREYAPNSGQLSVDLDLTRMPGSRTPGLDIRVEVEDVGCTLAVFPVPVDSASGQLRVVSTSSGESGSAWNLDGTIGDANFQVRGRERSERAPQDERKRLVSALEVSAKNVDINGPVRHALTPETLETIDALHLLGTVSAHLENHAAGEHTRSLEINPEPMMSAAPESFPARVHDLNGTLRLAWGQTDEGQPSPTVQPSGMTMTAPGITGTGTNGETITFTASGAEDDWSGVLFATGLAASLGDNAEAFSTITSEERGLSIEGVVDLRADLARSKQETQESQGSGLETDLEITLRSNTLLKGEDVLLKDLKGRFHLEGDDITAPRIEARLANSAITFEELKLENTPLELSLRTGIRASGIPLDAEHMASLLEEDVLASLIEELGLRGSVDVEEGDLELNAPHDGTPTIRFQGSLTIVNAALEAGLPIIIQSAHAEIEDLVMSDGHLRGWGRIEDLYGNCFESDLGPVKALVSYVDGVLSVEDFSGSFERGTIGPLDAALNPSKIHRGRPALTIELRPPFPYHASLALTEMDASRWVDGISSDAMEGSGVLSLEADLKGDLNELVETRGSGKVHLSRSRLWSIPLFRELLREFNLDHTVVFDEIRFDYRIGEGAIQMDEINLRSPLLQLVGEGSLSMEGDLNHQLEVHYSLVDKIAPLRRLFYLIQNIFVSVSIRGDLSRPIVRLNNGLFSLFRKEPEIRSSLPLPGLSPLPRRF